MLAIEVRPGDQLRGPDGFIVYTVTGEPIRLGSMLQDGLTGEFGEACGFEIRWTIDGARDERRFFVSDQVPLHRPAVDLSIPSDWKAAEPRLEEAGS